MESVDATTTCVVIGRMEEQGRDVASAALTREAVEQTNGTMEVPLTLTQMWYTKTCPLGEGHGCCKHGEWVEGDLGHVVIKWGKPREVMVVQGRHVRATTVWVEAPCMQNGATLGVDKVQKACERGEADAGDSDGEEHLGRFLGLAT